MKEIAFLDPERDTVTIYKRYIPKLKAMGYKQK